MEETVRLPLTERTRPTFALRLLRDTAYTLTALPIAVLTFAIAVTGLSAGLGLVVVWVGLPVLVGTVLASRVFAQLERLRLRSMLDLPGPLPTYRKVEADASPLRRLLTPLRDPQSWLDTLWGIVGFVTGLVAFVVTVAWWSTALGGLTYWLWQRWIPDSSDSTTLPELLGFDDGRTTEIWFNLGIGAFALLTLPVLVRAVAAMHGGTARAMLDGRALLRADRG